MATIRKVLQLTASADDVWAALRDYGNVHKRIAPGFVTACHMEGDDVRVVTFANGSTAHERLVSMDDKLRRVCYAIKSDRITHHSASAEVVPDGKGCKFIWTTDVLPGEIAPYIDGQMQEGTVVMTETLNKAA